MHKQILKKSQVKLTQSEEKIFKLKKNYLTSQNRF